MKQIMASISGVSLFIWCMSISTGFSQDIMHSSGNSREINAGASAFRATDVGMDSLTLDEAIHIALRNNPKINAADHETQAAMHRVKSLKSERYPNIGVQTDYNHYIKDQRLIPAPKPRDWTLPFTKDIASLDFTLTVPLFTSGRLSNEIKAAELLHGASILGLAHSKNELIFNISSLYFSILAQHHVVASLEFSKQAINEHLKTITR